MSYDTFAALEAAYPDLDAWIGDIDDPQIDQQQLDLLFGPNQRIACAIQSTTGSPKGEIAYLVVAAWQSGTTDTRALAAQFGVPPDAVCRYLRRAGISLHPHRASQRALDTLRPQAIALAATGKDATAVSEVLQLAPSTVRRWIASARKTGQL